MPAFLAKGSDRDSPPSALCEHRCRYHPFADAAYVPAGLQSHLWEKSYDSSEGDTPNHGANGRNALGESVHDGGVPPATHPPHFYSGAAPIIASPSRGFLSPNGD